MHGKADKLVNQLAEAIESGVDVKGAHGHKNISKGLIVWQGKANIWLQMFVLLAEPMLCRMQVVDALLMVLACHMGV
jgi:hypothetical protein